METEIIVVHRYASFQALRQYLRDLKVKGQRYSLVDRRDVHVFLLMPDGEGMVFKSRTFNVELAKTWATERFPGSCVAFIKRVGEWQYDEEIAAQRWQSPQPPASANKTENLQTYRVVTKKPMEDAVVETWSDISLDTQQRFVQGLIEISRLGINDEWSLVFNEEGKLNSDFKPNLKQMYQGQLYDVIVGPVFILKVDETGCSIGLTEAEAQFASALLNRMAVAPDELSHFESALMQFR